MNVFIDTNLYLAFYHYSQDDLEELKKLSVSIEGNKIRLFLTKQVVTEFKRNRESKIHDALKKFNERELNNEFPQFCKEYPEYKELRNAVKDFNKNKAIILKKLAEDIQKEQLGADKVIQELFTIANIIDTDPVVIESARTRSSVGNPPGKSGSLGDAINWEALLKEIPAEEDLYLISDDSDYFSPIDNSKLSKFLSDEWKSLKHSDIHFFRRLSDFFNEKFPLIELASDLARGLAISGLAESHTFAQTHIVIKKLSQISDLTSEELNEIFYSAVTNDQVYLIQEDEDIRSFFNALVATRANEINPDVMTVYYRLFQKSS